MKAWIYVVNKDDFLDNKELVPSGNYWDYSRKNKKTFKHNIDEKYKYMLE